MLQFVPGLRVRIVGVAAGIAVLSALHYAAPPSQFHWHNTIQQLFYLPVVWAALSFGWRGGLGVALLTGIANLPFILAIWSAFPNLAIDQTSEIPLFCAAGAFTGVLAERGRKQRSDLERTTQTLTAVYKELQDNFEQMKRAERLFALGQLSAGLAHEVRNPLASIAGAAGILQRNLHLEGMEAECLGIITKECRRLNHLVTHFLAFARPRPPAYQNLMVADLFDSVLELAAHATSGKPVTLRKETGALETIEGDPELLQQVLLNLVINAIQAMPDGGEVLLSAKLREGRAVIQVRDQGCGIKALDRDRIFDPFYTTKETGTGLGLSIAHKIVEQHGGVLTAESNAAGGMTFSVSLPLRHVRQHETEYHPGS